ncbi:MAG: nucleoside kinase, partial [Alistipes sp.]|nr:nucleoside kinase [Alistipes sp.]
MKKDSICVICENNHESWSVDFGTPLSELVARLGEQPYPVLAAMVNNRIKELSYRIYTPVTVRFIDATSFAGIRVLQRTAWFILQMAVGRCYPGRKLYIRHSMGQSGFYCEIEGVKHLTKTDTERLAEEIHRITESDYAIRREKLLTEEVRRRYAERGFTDKIELLDSCPRLYSDLYTMADEVGYFYGALAPSSGYLGHFCLRPYYEGFYIGLPLRTAPDTVCCELTQDKMADVFREYQSWVDM